MRVKMHTIYAGPDGSYQPGQEVDLNETLAKKLISCGFAHLLEVKEKAHAEVKEVTEEIKHTKEEIIEETIEEIMKVQPKPKKKR